MLRVGLTGDLGSGKSTVAAIFAELGAVVFSSDEMARAMMQPGHDVYSQIVRLFGESVLAADRSLDRRSLARLAFADGRAEELNSIVHPAVLAEQARLLTELGRRDPHTVAIVESALIFTTKHGVEGQAWRERFDRIVLVTAPLETKIARFVARMSSGRELTAAEKLQMEQDARARLSLQSSVNASHAAECLVVDNDDGVAGLRERVQAVWQELQQAEGPLEEPAR